jgi:hypothetical protein
VKVTRHNAEDQLKADPLRAQTEPRAEERESPLAQKIWGLKNAVDAISDAEKSISQRISKRAI